MRITLHFRKKSQDYFYLLLVFASATTLALYLFAASSSSSSTTQQQQQQAAAEVFRISPQVPSPFLTSLQQQQQSFNHHNHHDRSKSSVPGTTKTKKTKCALLFFGLPRAFRTIVLPSIIENVLRPTAVAQYNCDVYAHYYRVDHEKPGRGHKGGKIEQDAVQLLRQAVANVSATSPSERGGTAAAAAAPTVRIISDTDEQFWLQRNATVQKYRTTMDNTTGKYLYFPWKDRGYLYPLSLDNIVKQWHSVNAVFQDMEATCGGQQQQQPCYERIAMLRLDVFYATPIDIYQIDSKGTKDTLNQFAVLPAFGKHPVNDRMIYGPYQAVKIWATERFQRIEEHVRTYEPGYGMHSERFLNHSILPAMKQTGIRVRENPNICFMRVRADESIWTWDCNLSSHRTRRNKTRGMGKINKKTLIEGILQRNCTETTLSTGVKPVTCTE